MVEVVVEAFSVSTFWDPQKRSEADSSTTVFKAFSVSEWTDFFLMDFELIFFLSSRFCVTPLLRVSLFLSLLLSPGASNRCSYSCSSSSVDIAVIRSTPLFCSRSCVCPMRLETLNPPLSLISSLSHTSSSSSSSLSDISSLPPPLLPLPPSLSL